MERTTVTLTSFVRSCRILFLLPHIILLMRFFPVAWEPRSDKNVSYESATLRTQVFGYRLCASRLAANLVLPAHAVPSIRELYHRKWDITLLAALASSEKKHVTDRLLAGGWTTCKVGNLFSQYIHFSFGLFDRVQFDTRRMFLPKFFCLASVFWSLLLAVPPCSRCFWDGLTFQPVLQKLASASPASDCFLHLLGSLHFLIADS